MLTAHKPLCHQKVIKHLIKPPPALTDWKLGWSRNFFLNGPNCPQLNNWLVSFSDSIQITRGILNICQFLYNHLCVLHRDLQDECEAAVVKGLIQSDERSVDSALQQVAAVVPQTNGQDPVNHLLVGPHQHIFSERDRFMLLWVQF